MATTNPNRLRLIKLIHVGRRELGMDDETYRLLLAGMKGWTVRHQPRSSLFQISTEYWNSSSCEGSRSVRTGSPALWRTTASRGRSARSGWRCISRESSTIHRSARSLHSCSGQRASPRSSGSRPTRPATSSRGSRNGRIGKSAQQYGRRDAGRAGGSRRAVRNRDPARQP